MTNKTLSGRGGARAGAGRPKGRKTDTVIYYRRVKPEFVKKLDKYLNYLKGAKTMNNTEIEISDLLVNYFAGSNIDFTQFGSKENEVRELFALANRAWDKLETTPEGFTPEQDKIADALLDDYTKQILAIIK